MIGGVPSLGLSSSSSAKSSADAMFQGGTSGAGYRGSVIQNIATGGSRVDGKVGFSTVPEWIWWVVGLGGFGLLAWRVMKGKTK